MKIFIAATLGSLGFGLMFGNRGIKLLFSALGGSVCWGAYLLAGRFGAAGFLQVIIAALVAAMPLVPGSGLYRTMDAVLAADREAALRYGISTVTDAAAIAVGIVAVSLVFKYASRLQRLAKRKVK